MEKTDYDEDINIDGKCVSIQKSMENGISSCNLFPDVGASAHPVDCIHNKKCKPGFKAYPQSYGTTFVTMIFPRKLAELSLEPRELLQYVMRGGLIESVAYGVPLAEHESLSGGRHWRL